MIGNHLIGCTPLATPSQDESAPGVDAWIVLCKNQNTWTESPKPVTDSRECDNETKCL